MLVAECGVVDEGRELGDAVDAGEVDAAAGSEEDDEDDEDGEEEEAGGIVGAGVGRLAGGEVEGGVAAAISSEAGSVSRPQPPRRTSGWGRRA